MIDSNHTVGPGIEWDQTWQHCKTRGRCWARVMWGGPSKKPPTCPDCGAAVDLPKDHPARAVAGEGA